MIPFGGTSRHALACFIVLISRSTMKGQVGLVPPEVYR
jgi:hypothetical protein